ncbi:MAG TPA: MFS transporter [Phenylobacterium sp.]|uniref:MFS transporter n=1 Tax=Phenylobacterium sp. TaxID=1871053 RepID=UPI002B4977B3|nr:MFS transporter [Phenylobacterium sp.]HKR88878.1 MFS transporter [Phenylobacterium sp.]
MEPDYLRRWIETESAGVTELSPAHGIEHPIEDAAPAQAWFTLWALIAILLFAFVDRQILSLVAAPLSKSLGLSNSQLGAVQGLGAAAFSLLATYPAAWLADRFDRRLVLAGCMVIWAGGTVACGLAQGFASLFFAVVAVTAGEAGAAPLILSVVPDLFNGRERVTANLIYYFFALVSASLGMMFGGAAVAGLDKIHSALPPLFQGFESWRLAFFLVAAPLPLFLGLTLFMRLRRPAHHPAQKAAQSPSRAALGPHLLAHRRTIGLILAAISLMTLASGGMLAWMPVSMARIFGVTPAENGIALGLSCLFGALAGVGGASLLQRWLQPRLGRRAALRLIWVPLLCAAPTVLAMPMVSAAWQGFALVGVYVGFATLSGSLMPSVLQDLAPSHVRARFMAIYSILVTLFGAIGVLAPAGLSDLLTSGPRSLLWGVLLVSFPSTLLSAATMYAAEKPFERTAEDLAEGISELSAR